MKDIKQEIIEELQRDFTFLWKNGGETREDWKQDAINFLSTSINKALTAQLDRLEEEVEGMKKKIDIDIPDTLHRNTGYNQALEKIQQALAQERLTIK